MTTPSPDETFKPAKTIAANESTVTVRVDGVGDVTISWCQLRAAVANGGRLGMIYYYLAEEADRLRDESRLHRVLAQGYTVGSIEVGCRFGRRGVIRHSGKVVFYGTLLPFDAHGAAMRQVVNQWLVRS